MKSIRILSGSLRGSRELTIIIFILSLWSPALFAQPATSHPRLWIRQSDLPRLRSWAVDSNPFYAGGLSPLLDYAKTQMDEVDPNNDPPSPNIPNADTGQRQWEPYPTELYAHLFAFMSLISSSQAERDALAQRSRTLLMHVINEAIKGPDTNAVPARFRDPLFYTYDSNRARFYGEAYALTVDWIYPYLTAADKSAIRTVFLRWADEIVHSAYPKSPEPVGVTNDPALLAPSTLYGSPFNPMRWAGNNYFTGNMRNLGLMALAFDAEDDPGGQLRGYLANAAGAFLYIVDHLLRTDSRGGLLPEGFEYGPQTGAYIVQFLLAMHTAGQADPKVWGPQVVLTNNPFWNDFIPAYLHSLSPAPVINPDEEWRGQLYRVAWFGDGEQTHAPDFIAALGPLAVYAQLTGDSKRPADIRWIQTYLPPGGPDGLLARASDNNFFSSSLFYFLLFDPAAGEPTDPHKALGLTFFAPGMQRVLARTSWETNASWFTYKLGWNGIDHQLGDGNQIELYRRGEFLTKERTGWGLDAGSSDNHNTLALENDPPAHNTPDDYRNVLWQRGSQWVYLSGKDPQILARSFRDEFVYLLGDATPLYNWAEENSTDIVEASRSVCWLKPDHLVVYDRAASATGNRFKRFWLNFATNAVVAGNRSTVTLASGQQVFVNTLLPEGALIASEANPDPPLFGSVAAFEPMRFRLRVEAPGNPQRTRFLHVIQGADPGAVADPVSLVRTSSGTAFAGALVHGTLVLFPENLDAPFMSLAYTVTANATAHWITGLTPNQGYRVETQPLGTDLSVTITPGGNTMTDDGGVLVLTPGGQPNPSVAIASVARLTNGVVRLRFTESAGRTYTVQASFDLEQWTDLGTATLGADGVFQFEDDTSTDSAWRFYRLYLKDFYEAARKSPTLDGYHYWLMADLPGGVEGDPSCLGIFNMFYEPDKFPDPKPVLRFNRETVLLVSADGNNRVIGATESKPISISVSHYGDKPIRNGKLLWQLKKGSKIVDQGFADGINVEGGKVEDIGKLSINPGVLDRAAKLTLEARLDSATCKQDNAWNFWAFPAKKRDFAGSGIVNRTKLAALNERFGADSAIQQGKTRTVVTDKMDASVLDFVNGGGNVVLLTEEDVLQHPVPIAYWPQGLRSVGYVVENHPAINDFPNDGFCTYQFYRLFGTAVDSLDLTTKNSIERNKFIPAVWGMKADFDPAMGFTWSDPRNRTKLYQCGLICEGRIGAGKIVTCSLRVLTGIRNNLPEAGYLVDCLVDYALTDQFAPKSEPMTIEEAKRIFN